MKKTLIIALVILVICPAIAFADNTLSLLFGPIVSYEKDLIDVINSYREGSRSLDPKKLSYGADVRLQFSALELGATAFPQNGIIVQAADSEGNSAQKIEKFILSGIIYLDFGLKFGKSRISAGIGYNWDYNITTDGLSFLNTENGLKEEIMTSKINVRVAADFTLSDHIVIGASGVVPTNMSLQTTSVSDIQSLKDLWVDTKLGVSFLYKI